MSKWKCGFESQTKNGQGLWTPNEKGDSFDIEMKMWLWTPNWRCGFECQNENAALNAKWKMNKGSERQTKNE